MFNAENISAEIVGIDWIERGRCSRKSFQRRYSSLGIRLLGEAVFETGDERFTVGEGEIIYIPPSISYSQKTESEQVISVRFIEHTQPSGKIEVIKPQSIEAMKNIFSQMHKVWSDKERGYRSMCTSLLYRAFYELGADFGQESEQVTEAAGICTAAEYINKHYKDGDIRISALARSVYMSEGGFRKSFEKRYGVSPLKYLKLVRLENARSLLESGLYSVCEAAELSGFTDAKYFSREFSRHYGKSPSSFIKCFINKKTG